MNRQNYTMEEMQKEKEDLDILFDVVIYEMDMQDIPWTKTLFIDLITLGVNNIEHHFDGDVYDLPNDLGQDLEDIENMAFELYPEKDIRIQWMVELLNCYRLY